MCVLYVCVLIVRLCVLVSIAAVELLWVSVLGTDRCELSLPACPYHKACV